MIKSTTSLYPRLELSEDPGQYHISMLGIRAIKQHQIFPSNIHIAREGHSSKVPTRLRLFSHPHLYILLLTFLHSGGMVHSIALLVIGAFKRPASSIMVLEYPGNVQDRKGWLRRRTWHMAAHLEAELQLSKQRTLEPFEGAIKISPKTSHFALKTSESPMRSICKCLNRSLTDSRAQSPAASLCVVVETADLRSLATRPLSEHSGMPACLRTL